MTVAHVRRPEGRERSSQLRIGEAGFHRPRQRFRRGSGKNQRERVIDERIREAHLGAGASCGQADEHRAAGIHDGRW